MERMSKKKGNKHPKIKKREPLKVVYISNPIKFQATASEFMALVQGLTGQDADTPESPTLTVDDGGSGGETAAKAAADDNVHAELQVDQQGSDPSNFGSFNDFLLSPEMIENLQGFVGSNLVDVLKNLDANAMLCDRN